MYSFLKTLQPGNQVEKAEKNMEDKERLAKLIDAAEQVLTHEILYPEPGDVMEVDERTARAIREIQQEVVKIYGNPLAAELSDNETNPLCRGIYTFESCQSMHSRDWNILDNTKGAAIGCSTFSADLAMKAACAISDNPDLDLVDVVDNLESISIKRIEHRLALAIEELLADTRKDLLNNFHAEDCDFAELDLAASRLSALKALSDCRQLPIDGEFILQHTNEQPEVIESPEYLKAIALHLADDASSWMRFEANEVFDTTLVDSFLKSASHEGLSELESVSRTASESGTRGAKTAKIEQDQER